MAATRTVLKQYFKKYATPTEEQFAALIDAFVHKDEDSLTQSKIDGLTAALESKVSSSDLASAVATAVAETLQGGNIEVTPAAHQHAIADVEGLQAFVTKVNNFLESADVSDETINRWVEIETFLTGITDQETLAGLLLNLKNEILAQIPEPQTGNYLKQISDLDAYTEAQEGEIVQYVGTSTAEYTRGLCYEKVEKSTVIPANSYYFDFQSSLEMGDLVIPAGKYQQIVTQPRPTVTAYTLNISNYSVYGVQLDLIRPGDVVFCVGLDEKYLTVTAVENETIHISDGENEYTMTNGRTYGNYNGSFEYQDYRIHTSNSQFHLVEHQDHYYLKESHNDIPFPVKTTTDIATIEVSWQPLVTSPAVS